MKSTTYTTFKFHGWEQEDPKHQPLSIITDRRLICKHTKIDYMVSWNEIRKYLATQLHPWNSNFKGTRVRNPQKLLQTLNLTNGSSGLNN